MNTAKEPIIAPSYVFPRKCLFEIQASANYDEAGENIRSALNWGSCEVLTVDHLYGGTLDSDSLDGQRVREFFSGESFVVPENILVVRTPVGLIKDEDLARKWPFKFAGLHSSLNAKTAGSGFFRCAVSRIVSLDRTEFIRASGKENHDLVVVHFSTEVRGVGGKVQLPSLDFFDNPYHSNLKDPQRVAVHLLASATYGNELVVWPKVSESPRGNNRWFSRNDVGFRILARRPSNADEFERLAFHTAMHTYESVQDMFEHFPVLDQFLFRGKKLETNFRGERAYLFILQAGKNFYSCDQYIESLKQFIAMIDRAITFLENVKHLPSGFYYDEFSEMGEVGFCKYRDDDAKKLLDDLRGGKKRAQDIIDAVHRELVPHIEETRRIWQNKWGSKYDIPRVAFHYMLLQIAADPVLYLDHKNPFVRDYAYKLVNG